MTGQNSRQNVDDGTFTASVKNTLAAENAATLTKIDREHHKGTVPLTGMMENVAMTRERTVLLAPIRRRVILAW
jgi:hypothetical protein